MWNTFKNLLPGSGSKRKREESESPGQPKKFRRNSSPKTPTRPSRASSLQKENRRPGAPSSSTGTTKAKSPTPGRVSFEDDVRVEEEDGGDLEPSGDNAEDDTEATGTPLPTIEYDEDAASGSEGDDEADEEYEPEAPVPVKKNDVVVIRPRKVQVKRTSAADSAYRPDLQEDDDDEEFDDEDELAPPRKDKGKGRAVTPSPRQDKGKRHTADEADYRPDPEEEDDDEEFEDDPLLGQHKRAVRATPATPASGKSKSTATPSTSSPSSRRAAFNRSNSISGDEMEVISESDEEPESDWELEGDELDDALDEYYKGIQELPSYHAWCREDKKLHKTLYLRGLHPLMPATWNFDFLGYPGIPPALYAPLDSDKPVLIHNCSPNGSFHTTKAIRGLIDLQNRVICLRQTDQPEKVGPLLVKELRRYINYVMKECQLTQYDFAPTLKVRSYDMKKSGKANFAQVVQDWFDDWAEEHRTWYADRKINAPRLLYGFVVVSHAIMVITQDTWRADARAKPFADINMGEQQQWLDPTLQICIPIFIARNRLLKLASTFPKLPGDGDDDPDA